MTQNFLKQCDLKNQNHKITAFNSISVWDDGVFYLAQKFPPISIIYSVYWSFSEKEDRKGNFMSIILGWMKGFFESPNYHDCKCELINTCTNKHLHVCWIDCYKDSCICLHMINVIYSLIVSMCLTNYSFYVAQNFCTIA